MFEAFQAQYPRDHQRADGGIAVSVPNLDELPAFLKEFGGTSYSNGLYRIITPSSISVWAERIEIAFPEYGSRATCFAYDWLGRAFALDSERFEGGRPSVVLLEPGTGEVLEIPCNLETFHTDELLEYGEAALAISFYEKWLAAGGSAPEFDQCIGYRKPLFLGGADEVENLELSDLDVYWHLFGQMVQQTRGLPPGTPVRIKLK